MNPQKDPRKERSPLVEALLILLKILVGIAVAFMLLAGFILGACYFGR
jgi:hypothetical protein